jgi:integrase
MAANKAQVSLEGRRLSKTFDTVTEAMSWIRVTLNQIDDGLTYKGANTTLNEFLDLWLGAMQSHLRPNTIVQYTQVCQDHIRPYLGKMKIWDIKAGNAQSLYRRIEKKTGVRTARLTHSVLHRAFVHAVQLGVVSANPTAAAVLPKNNKQEMHVLNEAQAAQFLAALQGHHREALYYLAITTGMRQGELLGLKWADIDWVKKTLRVSRQVRRKAEGDLEFADPKTRYGKRTIVVGDVTIE